MSTTAIVILIVAVIVVAAVAWALYRERRSKGLRSKFGPEYDRAVHDYGRRDKAENALEARQKRVEKFSIHSLTPLERDDFATRWHDVQAKFVDDPSASIEDADRLVTDVMKARGYPVAEYEHRVEDLSVDYGHVIRNYRAAHAIALRNASGDATTEDMRQAVVYYRELFDELLEAHTAGPGRTR